MVEAYCPLVRGQRFEEEALRVLAKRYGKTPAQVLVRWSLQKVRGSFLLFSFLFFLSFHDDEVESVADFMFFFSGRDSCRCQSR